ncbi:MAG: hypothetical protein IPJ90_07370 [Anaerolineaceae bacterium]|nr:hypothetical protein [Anaerolineaceae bacterium]
MVALRFERLKAAQDGSEIFCKDGELVGWGAAGEQVNCAIAGYKLVQAAPRVCGFWQIKDQLPFDNAEIVNGDFGAAYGDGWGSCCWA